MFKNILCATDRIRFQDTPVLVAFDMAKQNNGKLNVLHVLESASLLNRRLVKHFKTGEEIETDSIYENEIREEIKNTYAEKLKSHGNFEIRITPGYPCREISAWAKELCADLIVVGPHSGRALERGVLRGPQKMKGTAEGIFEDERCPVMIINQPPSEKMLRFKMIMVSVDFSVSCMLAFQFAIKLARPYGSKVYLYHMVPVHPFSGYTQEKYNADIDFAKKKLDRMCRAVSQDLNVEYEVWGGAHPHLEILNYAVSKDVDIIVMGSHIKEKSGKWYGGSVVESVSSLSKCPVMVVNNPGIVSENPIPDGRRHRGSFFYVISPASFAKKSIA